MVIILYFIYKLTIYTLLIKKKYKIFLILHDIYMWNFTQHIQ